VTYLLDVNALLALGYQAHTHHPRVEAWLAARKKDIGLALATCAITELGFVRVASGSAVAHAIDVTTAKRALARLKSNALVHFVFLNDHLGRVKRVPLKRGLLALFSGLIRHLFVGMTSSNS
jgi:predicted nucleic acid-binding protein